MLFCILNRGNAKPIQKPLMLALLAGAWLQREDHDSEILKITYEQEYLK